MRNFEQIKPEHPEVTTIDDLRASVPVIKTTELDATTKTTSSAEPNDAYPDRFAAPQDKYPEKYV